MLEATAATPTAAVPWFHAQAKGDGIVHLRLAGALPDDWSLRFTRALAWRNLSLRSGRARRVETRHWIAHLELDLVYADAEVDFSEILELATRAEDLPAPPEPRILDFELDAPAYLAGGLRLEVHAWDALGLLAGVIERADRVGLHPEALLLDTEGECAFHELILRGADGAPASAEQHRALEAILAALVRPG